jgi:hypothetical protein
LRIRFRLVELLRKIAFIELFARHSTREVVDTVLQTRSKDALRSLFIDTQIPAY